MGSDLVQTVCNISAGNTSRHRVNYISVSKCVGHSTLYLWDLKQHCVKKTGQKTVGVQLRPLAQLEYKEIDVDYLYISAYKGR